MKLLKLVTTFQSVVTILDSKLARLEAEPGMELHVASSFEDPAETRKPRGIHHTIRIPRTISPIQDLAAIISLYRLMRRHRFDVVHTHTAKAGIVGVVAARLAGVPLICHTYHGLPFYEGQKKRSYRLYRALEAFFCCFRQVVFSQNKRDFETLKTIPSIAGKTVFEGNGVDVETVQANAERERAAGEALFTGTGARILCCARLEPVKRLEKVVGLMEALKARGVAAQCVIAGKGEDQGRVEGLIREKGVAESMKVAYTPAIHALMAASDIVVLTSEKEGIPRSLMEAMALGKPVVATDVPGTDELVKDKETGFLVPLEDQAALVERVEGLIKDPELRRKMGEAGLKRVTAGFNDKVIAELWLKGYNNYLMKYGKTRPTPSPL